MNYTLSIAFIALIFSSCQKQYKEEDDKILSLANEIPYKEPLAFKPELTPENMLIHRGILPPDLNEYYFTISDKNYRKFDVRFIQKEANGWSEPKYAFFNSEYNDHGMSFSPDGKSLYFSSTRPVNIESVPETWHIWKSEKVNGKWSEPRFVDIPNLREKLVSHPTITRTGTMYFHASNLDYSEMDIYYAKQRNGKFDTARKVYNSLDHINKCTPHVSSEGKQLIFAVVGDKLDLHISFLNENEEWSKPERLNTTINTNGQGNPFVTSDGRFLFYAVEQPSATNEAGNWNINWISTKSF